MITAYSIIIYFLLVQPPRLHSLLPIKGFEFIQLLGALFYLLAGLQPGFMNH